MTNKLLALFVLATACGSSHEASADRGVRIPPSANGPRETAILAICDAVEAASRTIKRSDPTAIDSLVQRIVYGKLHSVERIRMENWDREVNIDLRGTFLVDRAVGVRMAERGHGSIVNIASVAGMTSGPIHAYTAAKAGVIQLTLTLAAEWGRSGVRVNAVSPGFTRTVALQAGIDSGAMNEERMSRNAAMGRLVDPIEVAQAIAWLLGPASSAVTGINLPVDAGFFAGATWDAYGGVRGPKARS